MPRPRAFWPAQRRLRGLLTQLADQPLPWANADTGSRGAISSLVEEKAAGVLCRRFTTSRESFDGVALYNGQACMVAPGVWRMERFAAP